jgi:hypothetical protein
MEKRRIKDIFNTAEINSIVKRIYQTRKIDKDDKISYEGTETNKNGIKYKISAEHVPVERIMEYSKSGCRTCGGLGRKIVNILKSRIPDPENYVVLSNQPIGQMTEEQRKIWIEKEKKNPFWRILLPCRCALKNIEKTGDIFSNPFGNITMRLDYEILDEAATDD